MPLEFDLLLVKTSEYSNLVLHKSGDLHETRHYGSAWTDMGDEYANLYVLFNPSYVKNMSDALLVELENKYNGEPCEDGAVCFAHQTKPCDNCGRLQGRIVIASSNRKITPKAILPDSFLSKYVCAYNSPNQLKKIMLGQEFSHMELIGNRYDEEINKISTDNDGYVQIVESFEKTSCEKHKKKIDAYLGTTENLVEDIGNLHYESLAEFMKLMSEKINKDAKKDSERGRHMLANSLFDASIGLSEAASHINDAWKISKPFMEPKNPF